jgi:murein L,D-transpeptidase YcbB/YkuD
MKQFFQHPIALFSIAFVLFSGCSSGLKESTNGSAAADSTLIEPVTVNNLFLDSMAVAGFLQTHPEYKEQEEQVWKFYSMRNYQYAWFNNDGMVEQASHMMNTLTHLREEGITDTVTVDTRLQQLYDTLSGGSYHLTGVDAINSEAELLLTATFFKYAEKIWGGIGEKDVEEVEWFIKKKRLPYVAILDSMLSNPTYFAQQRPVYRQYDLLKSQLKRYYELEKLDNWSPIVADKKSYKPGDSSAVLPAIRKRLFLLGDLATPDTTGTIYESILEVAVKISRIDMDSLLMAPSVLP